MKFFMSQNEDVKIVYHQSAIYPTDAELWFDSLPKDVQQHLREEYEYRRINDHPSGWIKFLEHVMHRTGVKVIKKGARLLLIIAYNHRLLTVIFTGSSRVS
jgi:hypothetical protein